MGNQNQKYLCADQNIKIIVESSSIAHSIGNFILKNIKTEHFFYPTNRCGDMTSWPYFMTSYSDITSYLRTRQFYQKMTSFNVFQCEISSRMSYMQTFYDNFENFRNLNFQWEVKIKSGQYLLLMVGFDKNKVDIRDQRQKLIEIIWWPLFFWIITFLQAHLKITIIQFFNFNCFF